MKKGPISLNCKLSAKWLKSDEADSMMNMRKAMDVMARNLNLKWKNTLGKGFPSM